MIFSFAKGAALVLFTLLAAGCTGFKHNGFGLHDLTVKTASVSGNTYYVATYGSNSNPGTEGAPWQTLSHAVSQLAPGDTLYIRGGIYTGGENLIDSQRTYVPSGTPESRITITGFPGESVTLRSPWGTAAIRLSSGNPSYLIFQDFTVDGYAHSGGVPTADFPGMGVELISVQYGSSHNRFLRLEVKWSLGNGIGFSGNNGNAFFNEIINCSIHDNGLDTSAPNPGYGAYVASSDNLIEGNEVYRNHGFGIHINGVNDSPSRNVIRNNSIHDNFCWDTGDGTGGHLAGGIAILSNKGSGEKAADSNLVYNNLLYRNGFNGNTSGAGIMVYTYSRNTRVFNNTIYQNNGYGISFQYYLEGNIAANNIVYANGTDIIDYGGIVGAPTLMNNLTTNPDFVNAPYDLSLQSSSPAIDRGVYLGEVLTDIAGNGRPAGGSHDIGAYEFGGTATRGPASDPTPQPTPPADWEPIRDPIGPDTNGAQFVSQNLPESMIPGNTYEISVTMKNTGTRMWDSAHFLGNSEIWVRVGTPTAPGATHTFTFTITAPSNPGTYTFRYQMVQAEVEWFGDFSAEVNVPVGESTQASRLLPQNEMRVTSATVNLAWATNILDGDSGTKWEVVGQTEEVYLDLGRAYNVTGFRYTEDWTRVQSYELFVSRDGADWGTPVAAGEMPSDGVIDFARKAGAYVKLRLNTDPRAGYCYVSEVGVMGY